MPIEHEGSSPDDQVLDSNSEVEETAQDVETTEENLEATSSNADDSKTSEDEHKSLLDVVKDAVEETSEEEVSEDTDTEDEDGEPDADSKAKEDASSASEEGEKGKEDEEDADFTDEDLAKEKPSTRKRIQKLISKLDDAHSRAEEYEPKAQRFQEISDFMATNGITSEEASEAFAVMALVKSDPAQALERLRQHVSTIEETLGEGNLPADLKQKVEDGLLDEDTAKEVSKARAQARFEREQREAYQQAEQQRTEQQQAQGQQQLVSNALDSWQASMQQKDPDYPIKHGFVKDKLTALIQQHGAPRTAQEANQYADIAYGMVNEELSKVAPKPQKKAKRAIPSRSTSGPSPTVKPDTTLGIIKQAVGK